ncbi:MAG: fatty acid desaturase family protein, partial [Methyloligellaceae bacterium]
MSTGQITIDQKDQLNSKPARINRDEMQVLKTRDNITNIFYIAQVYIITIVTITATVIAYSWFFNDNLSIWWLIPITVIAITIIGASQHQLGGITHEGTHYTLFSDRKTSELASDWFGAFPIYTTTYAFRLHHLAHHQFVNDPERDPNFDQAVDSGHWLDFPLTHMELLWGALKLLWLPNLVSYIIARAKYSAIGMDSNPYYDQDKTVNRLAVRCGIAFAVLVPVITVPLVFMELWLPVLLIQVAAWVGLTVYYLNIPEDDFPQSVIKPVISHRITAISRFTFLGLLYGAISLTEFLTGAPAWNYFLLLWILPLFTTFPVFMILREWLQHGNADRGRYTNTRIFLVNPLLRYAIFPFGMDYHLPHHLNASVPHYNLKSFHDLLLKDKKYSEQGVIVEGWVKSPNQASGNPTVIEVLGPEYSPPNEDIHIDPAVLEHAELSNKEAV